MNRKTTLAIVALPVGMIALLAKSAAALDVHSPASSQTPTTIAQRYDEQRINHRDDAQRQDEQRIDRRDDAQRYQNRRDEARREAIRRNEARREAIRRDEARRESIRRDENRRIWVSGHWQSGFLGIGGRWVEGHWENR